MSEVERRFRLLLVHQPQLVGDAVSRALDEVGFDVHRVRRLRRVEVDNALKFERPHVAVVAFSISDGSTAFDAIRSLVAQDVQVITIVSADDVRSALTSIDLGAAGYVRLRDPFSVLITAVVNAIAGSPVYDETTVQQLRRRQQATDRKRRDHLAEMTTLSPREEQVLADLVEGLSAVRIAQRRGITTSTARTHIKRILDKLSVTSQLEAVALVHQTGWRSPERRT